MAEVTNIIGIAAGVCTGISMLPQVIKILREKKADDVSLPMLLLLIAGLACWIWYGIRKQDWPIIATNSFSLLLNVLIVLLKWQYRNR